MNQFYVGLVLIKHHRWLTSVTVYGLIQYVGVRIPLSPSVINILTHPHFDLHVTLVGFVSRTILLSELPVCPDNPNTTLLYRTSQLLSDSHDSRYMDPIRSQRLWEDVVMITTSVPLMP